MDIVYLNGEFLAADQAKVSVFDRGFLFADSVYEVIPYYRGHGFQIEQHLTRLEYSLGELRISANQPWKRICDELVARNKGLNLSVYLQVTRGGTGKRSHNIPSDIPATVFACCNPIVDNYSRDSQEIKAVKVIVTEDLRWKRCDIKATTLLPNILALQQARDQSAHEALLLRDGSVQEGASSNFFIVERGVIVAPPSAQTILSGTTAQLVLLTAQEAGITVKRENISYHRLINAEEVWITSSTRGVVPVTEVDDQTIGDGVKGLLWHLLYQKVANKQRQLQQH